MDVNSILTKKDLDESEKRILQAMEIFFTPLKDDLDPIGHRAYLRSRDVRRLLNVSDNKLRDMRNAHEIPFSLIGKTYYYNEKEIWKVFQKNLRNTTHK